eukprot:gene37927-61327_t
MGWLVEQAGGAATDGKQRILDIKPTKLHQRVAVFLGSKNEQPDGVRWPATIAGLVAGVAQSVEQLIRNDAPTTENTPKSLCKSTQRLSSPAANVPSWHSVGTTPAILSANFSTVRPSVTAAALRRATVVPTTQPRHAPRS